MTNLDPAAPALITEADIAIHIGCVPGVVALHDRAIPGSRANIDHIVIAPSGVYVVDTNPTTGVVERRDNRLFVDGRDRTDLAIAMSHRVEAVSSALRDLRIPISRALCFVGGEWAATAPAFMLRGVWIGPPVQLYRLVAQPGLLQPSEVEAARQLLDERFRPLG